MLRNTCFNGNTFGIKQLRKLFFRTTEQILPENTKISRVSYNMVIPVSVNGNDVDVNTNLNVNSFQWVWTRVFPDRKEETQETGTAEEK